MHGHRDAMVKRKEHLQYVQVFNEYRDLFGIDGEPFEFEWNIFPGHTTVQIFHEIQERMTVRETRAEDFEDRIIFHVCVQRHRLEMGWTLQGMIFEF